MLTDRVEDTHVLHMNKAARAAARSVRLGFLLNIVADLIVLFGRLR